VVVVVVIVSCAPDTKCANFFDEVMEIIEIIRLDFMYRI